MMPLFQMQRCRPKNILKKNSLGDRYSHEKIVIPLLISTSVWNFQFHCTVHFENIITMPLTSTCTSNSDISLSWVMLNTSSVQSNKFQGCALRTIKGSLMLWPCEIQSTYNLGQNWRENCILEKHFSKHRRCTSSSLSPFTWKQCCCVFKKKPDPWTFVGSNIELGEGVFFPQRHRFGNSFVT